MGIGYSYRPTDDSAAVDLYLYSGQSEGLGDGINDPRVQARFESEWAGLQQSFQLLQAKVPLLQGPAVERLSDHNGTECHFYSVLFSAGGSNADLLSALSITALCGAFLKVRFTWRSIDLEDEAEVTAVRESLGPMNTDLAGFCCHFRGKVAAPTE